MDKISELKKIKAYINASGKSTREFIKAITDDLSFVEMDTYYKTNDNSNDPGEGVICGFARINDSPAYIFALNTDAQKGLSRHQADKILRCMESAEKSGYPLIAILNSLGAVVDDGLMPLDGYARIIAKASSLYGVIPQISIIKGECLGSFSFYAALSDFVFMLKDSVLCSSSPLVIAAKSGKNSDAKALFGADIHYSKTGIASRVCPDVTELSKELKALLSLFDEDIVEEDLGALNKISLKLNSVYSTAEIISGVFDKNSFFEISANFGGELICGLGKLGGFTVGAVLGKDGENVVLTSNACKKASKFIRFLDSFDIPLISFVNCEGIESNLQSEQGNLIKDFANLISAVADGQNVKLSVICGNVAAAGYIALAGKGLGFDYTLAWATSSINILPANVSVEVLESAALAAAKNPKKEREALKVKVLETDGNPVNAAYKGLVDNVIEPSNTRSYLLSVLMMLN